MLIWIGVFQMLALIPGTSRSGATIVGALIIGVSREVAAEFYILPGNSGHVWRQSTELVKLDFILQGQNSAC